MAKTHTTANRPAEAALVWTVVVLFLCEGSSCQPLNAERLQSMAEALQSATHEAIYSHAISLQTYLPDIELRYSAVAANGSFLVVSGTDIVERLSQQLSTEFAAMKDSLRASARLVSEDFSSSGCCSEECVGRRRSMEDCVRLCDISDPDIAEYYRAQYGTETTDDVGIGLETQNGMDTGLGSWQYLFAANVSFNFSAVHIPLDIYEKDPDVLCFLNWTAGLEDHFSAQRESLNHVTFQYFGSSTGLLRFYPATEWALLNQCQRCPLEPSDTFDARRRPWYTNTIGGDVAVVVLLDMSGSMAGFQSLLARLAIGELLNLLSQDDWFLVLRVDGDGTNSLGCFDQIVRASPENVIAMKDELVNTRENGGVADFDPAVREAVSLLEGRTECHKVVVLFTDAEGGRAISVSLFHRKQVRVFTYRIGRGSDDNHLTDIAAKCGGTVGYIRDYGDIFREIQSFASVLREQSLPTSREDEEVFFTQYRDVFGGRVLSLSQPVVRRVGNETRDVLGVVGMDLQPDTVMKWLQRENLSPTGYAFLVDNNGQLVVHPQIDSTYFTLLSADDLISLDVANYEHTFNSSDFESIRVSILNRAGGAEMITGQSTAEVWAVVERGRHYILRNVTYFYAPVNGTPYAVVVVLPSSAFEILRYPPEVPDVDDVCLKADGLTEMFVHLERRLYCVWTLDPQEDPVVFLKTLLCGQCPFLDQSTCSLNLSACSTNFSTPLLQNIWIFPVRRNVHSSSLFVQFSSGMTLCAGEMFSDGTLACANLPRYINLIEEGRNRTIVLTGLQSNGTVSVEYLVLLRSLAFKENQTSSSFRPGVFGMVLSKDYLSTELDSSSPSSVVSGKGSSEGDKTETSGHGSSEGVKNVASGHGSSDGDTISVPGHGSIEGEMPVVYAIDETMRIAASVGHTEVVGQLFPDIQHEITTQLVDKGVITTAQLKGYEVRPCDFLRNIKEVEEHCDNAGTSLNQGVLITLVWWLLKGAWWTSLKLTVLSILSTVLNLFGAALGYSGSDDGCNGINFCLHQSTVYYLNDGPFNESGTVECGGNELSYQALSVPSVRLLLVGVSSLACENTTLSPLDDECPLPCVCTHASPGAYRLPAHRLYDCTGNGTVCSSSFSINHRSFLHFLWTVFLSYCVIHWTALYS